MLKEVNRSDIAVRCLHMRRMNISMSSAGLASGGLRLERPRIYCVNRTMMPRIRLNGGAWVFLLQKIFRSIVDISKKIDIINVVKPIVNKVYSTSVEPLIYGVCTI